MFEIGKRRTKRRRKERLVCNGSRRSCSRSVKGVRNGEEKDD